MMKSDLAWLGSSLLLLLVTLLTDEALDLSVASVGMCLLVDIVIVYGYLLNKRVFTFELALISLIILFIFSKFLAGILELDYRFFTRTDLYASIDIPDDITKKIFVLYTILVNVVAVTVALIPIKGSRSKVETLSSTDWELNLYLLNKWAIFVLFLPYIYIQIEYLQAVAAAERGYLSVFTATDFWAAGYKDILTRFLYVNFSLFFIIAILFDEKIPKIIVLFLVIFLLLEILPGQRGHAVLFVLGLLVWKNTVRPVKLKLFKFVIASSTAVIALVFADIFRGSKAPLGNIVTYALNGFGMPLNLHQFSFYYSQQLKDYDKTYSMYAITEYFERIFNLSGGVNYEGRSGELLNQTSYMGHKISGIVNYEGWLIGYGTGSAFLAELILDFGELTAIIMLGLMFFAFRFFSRHVSYSRSIFWSLMYVTFTPFLLFIPRGSLANAVPNMISVLGYWCLMLAVVVLAKATWIKMIERSERKTSSPEILRL